VAKRFKTPTTKYKAAAAFQISTEVGRAQLWHQRIRRARKMLELDERKDQHKATIKFIDGSHGLTASGDYVYLNEALPALEDVIFGTVPKIPNVTVEARQLEQEPLADRVAALVDATLNSDLVRAYEALLAIEWDDISYGIGIGRMGWQEERREWNYRPTTDEEYLASHIAKAEEENENPATATVADNDDHGVHIQVHETRLSEADERLTAFDDEVLRKHVNVHWAEFGMRQWAYPVLHRVDPMRFVYDPDAQEWEDRRWEAELCDEFVYDLQHLPGIKHLNKENCPPLDEFDVPEDDLREAEEFDWESQKVKVWKIHDRVNNRYIILPASEGAETKPILEEDWPFGAMEIYNIIVHRPRNDTIHGYSALRLVAPILGELARTNAVIRRHNRRAAKYKMFLAGTLDKQALKKFNSENPVESMPPEALANHVEFKPPSLPKEVLEYREMLLAEMRRLLGSDVMQQGGDTPHAITASEAQLRGGYHATRLKRRRLTVSRFLTWVATNIVFMYRDFSEGELGVRVVGSRGAEIQHLDPSAIPDDLVVKLDIENVSEEKRNRDMFAAQTFAEMAAKIAPGGYDPFALLVLLGEQMGISNPEKIFVAPEEPGGPAATASPQRPSIQNAPSVGASAEGVPEAPSVPNLRVVQG